MVKSVITSEISGEHVRVATVSSMDKLMRGENAIDQRVLVECRTKDKSIEPRQHPETITRVEVVDSDGNHHSFENVKFVIYEVG